MLALHFCSFFYSLSIQQTFYSFVMSIFSGLSYFLLMACSKRGLMGKRIRGGWLASLSHPVIQGPNIFHPSGSTIPQMLRVLPWSQSIILPKQQSSLSQQHRRACASVFANLTNCQNQDDAMYFHWPAERMMSQTLAAQFQEAARYQTKLSYEF